MTYKEIKIIVAIIIPIAILFGLATSIVAKKLDSLIDVEYSKCVNAMEKVGDTCSK